MSKKPNTALVQAARTQSQMAVSSIDIEAALTKHGADSTQALVDIRIAKLERDLTGQAEEKRKEIEGINAQTATAEKAVLDVGWCGVEVHDEGYEASCR